MDFKCNDGFRLEGPGWIKCQDNGEFNDDPPVCVPDCELYNYSKANCVTALDMARQQNFQENLKNLSVIKSDQI